MRPDVRSGARPTSPAASASFPPRLPIADTSIIVVTWNSGRHLERCLAAYGRSPGEIIVVDSASTDDTCAIVRTRFPRVRLIELPDNRGYGFAANEGLRRATGEYALVSNSDAWPVGDGVARLTSAARARGALGVAGPRLRNVDGSLQPSMRGFPTPWRLASVYLLLRRLAPRSPLLNGLFAAGFDHRSAREADWLVGAVLLVRRDALDEVGSFDTDFFMYGEELDLCYRMHAAGREVAFLPEAEFTHIGGATTRLRSREMIVEMMRSHLRFMAKHHDLKRAERTRTVLLAAMRVRGALLPREHGVLARHAARWLASGTADTLIPIPPAPRESRKGVPRT